MNHDIARKPMPAIEAGAFIVFIVLAVMAAPGHAAGTTIRLTGSVLQLDPVRAPDVYTQAVAGTLFDQLYVFDYVARPLQLRPLAAADLPRISADGREITIAIRRGIVFSPHPSFGGRPRELTAEDVIYSVKRFMDPAVRSPIMALVAGRIEGLDELASRTIARQEAFDYDATVSGLIAVDRYTVRIRLAHADPAFVYFLANPDLSIVPREAIEADGDEFARRPTGSGPYRVREFKPGTRLVLERNPDYRVVHWEDIATAGPSDPAWAKALNGRRFPLPDLVELTDIPEAMTALLAFERGDVDIVSAPASAIQNNQLVARLAQMGFTLVRAPSPTLSWFSFNMNDAQVGGMMPASIALRRAIAMSIDDAEYIRLFYNGAAAPPETWIPPGILGHDSAYRNSIRYDPATANALLDHFGYRKADDGFRRSPDGRAFTLTITVGTGSRERQWSEFMKRSIDRIALHVRFDAVEFAEIVSRQVNCRFQIHGNGGWTFDWPDASNLMVAFHGTAGGAVNEPCMHDAEFDALYERLLETPVDARAPLYRRLVDRLNTITPVRLMPQRDELYLVAPGVRGFLIHPAPGPNYAAYPYVDVSGKRANARR